MINRFDREVTGGIWLEMTFLCNVLIIIFHFLSLKNKLFQNIKLFLYRFSHDTMCHHIRGGGYFNEVFQ